MRKLHFKSVYITGFSYYDENAVTLYFEDYKLGYIPKESNKSIAKLLNAGYVFYKYYLEDRF